MSGARSPAKSHEAIHSDHGAVRPWAQWVRWWIALTIAVGAALYFLRALGQQTVCSQSLGGTQNTEAVQLCGPPRLLDLVPFVLIIGVVLWPDLNELSISNIVTLKRRVREQQARQDALESQLGLLQQHVSQAVLLAQSQSQATTQSVVVAGPYAPAQDDLRAGIEQKEHLKADPGTARRVERLDDERLQLLGTFVDAYSDLEPYIKIAGVAPGNPFVAFADDVPVRDLAELDVVREWAAGYRAEISALRETRNVAVHRPATVSSTTLRGALENTRRLHRVLDGALALSRTQHEPSDIAGDQR